MITVTCEKTGIQFESDSKRQKNHPRVSAFVNDANKDNRHYAGAYGAALNIVAEIKAAGITDIDDAMTYVNEAYAAWKNGTAKPIIRKTQGDYMREAKDRRNERERVNEILKAHGYRWEKEDYGTEDDFLPGSYNAGIGEYAGSRWTLYAADNRHVSIQQAMKEIEASK